ncbi:MAG: hypothetical protein ACC655_02445 [Rhodothermia bacterium]
MKKYILLIAVLFGFGAAQVSRAQSNLTSISYEMSLPLSDTKNLINSTSFIGFMFDTRRFVQPNTTIGVSFGLHVFDDKVDDELIQLEGVFEGSRNLDIWGTQYRYINSWPLMLNSFYYFGDRRSTVRPYLGTGVGAFIARRRLDAGLSSLAETKWQFGHSPELGFLYDMGELNLLLKATYNYGLKSGNAKALQYATIAVGFAWTGY